MALLTHSGYGTQNITQGTQQYDFSPILLANLRLEEAVISHLDINPNAVTDTVAYWQEDALVGNVVTLNANLGTGGTTLTLSAADMLKVGYNASTTLQRPGAILQVISSTGTTTVNGNGEQVQITAFGSSTTATITRAYGLTADPGTQYDTATTKLKLVGWPLPEGSTLGPDQSQARTVRYNYTQIFGRDITITRNQIMRRMQSLEDEFLYQLDQRAIEMKREMNDAVIFGSPSSSITGTFPQAVANGGDNRTFAGLNYFLQSAGGAAAGATFDNTSEALTPKVFNNMHYASAILGGNPLVVFTGGKQQRAIQAFGQDQIRTVPDERVRSGFTTLFRTDTGAILSLVTDFNMSNGLEDTVMMVDLTRTSLRYFTDAQFFVLVAPTFTDGDSARVLGEWSFECRNAIGTLAAHSIHTNLTIPS